MKFPPQQPLNTQLSAQKAETSECYMSSNTTISSSPTPHRPMSLVEAGGHPLRVWLHSSLPLLYNHALLPQLGNTDTGTQLLQLSSFVKVCTGPEHGTNWNWKTFLLPVFPDRPQTAAHWLPFSLLSDFLIEFYFHSIVSSKENSDNSKPTFQHSEGRVK